MGSKGALMKTPKLKKLIERRTKVEMWGRARFVTPRLVNQVFGDGKKLIGLAPTMYRPNYFVVRVDSSWNLSNYARDCELLIDHLDDVYDATEDEFCDWPWWRQYGLNPNRSRGEDNSARIDWSDGSSWWEEEWPAEDSR